MKTNPFHLRELFLTTALAVTTITLCQAQNTEVRRAEVKAERVEGSIRSLNPEALVIQMEGEPEPLAYRFAKTTQYVDEAGNAVTRETLVPGLPITVQYVREGDNVIATRVIVHPKMAKGVEAVVPAPVVVKNGERTADPATTRSTTTTTTTVTTEKVKPTVADGVLSRWEPDRFELNTPKNGIMKFSYSKDTQFMDVDDKHVDAIRMKSGLPVTVHFKQVGDRLDANKIILNVKSLEKVR